MRYSSAQIRRMSWQILPGIGVGLCAFLFTATVIMASTAQAFSDRSREENARQLQRLSAALEQQSQRQAALASEVQTLEGDRAALNQQLIDTAERIKAGEAQIESAEVRLHRLSKTEGLIRASLKSRRHVLTELLAALQRLGAEQPPAIIVRPEDALEAIRSAILLGTVVPGLRDEAAKLGDDLAELVRLRDAIETEKLALAANTKQLAEERIKIQALLESKRNTLAQTAQELDSVRHQAETLAQQTASLRELIAEMDKRILGQETAPRSPVDANPRVALNDPGRIRPAMAFANAQGLLPLPVSGSALQNFGDVDGFGGKAQGIAYVTRQDAQVTSPTDGWVVYAGAFRSYGQLLIINPGNGYHVVLAGMQRIDVEFGQFVLAGEPVAIMGKNSTLAHSIVTAGPSNRPILYVEFRKEGTSIDPAPWWASDEEKVRG